MRPKTLNLEDQILDVLELKATETKQLQSMSVIVNDALKDSMHEDL